MQPLWVVDADGLRSAPITFFDQQLLSFAKSRWQKPARIIGETMMEQVWLPMEPYFQGWRRDPGCPRRRPCGARAPRRARKPDGHPAKRGRQSEVRLRNQVPRGGAGTALAV